MRHNPGAVRDLFTTGDTTEVELGTSEKVPVNKALFDFLRHRDGMSDDAAQAFMEALGAAIGSAPEEGAPAFQPLLANDLKNIGDALQHESEQAAEEAGPLWKQIGHGLLDLVGMIPVAGEPADFVNGVWYYADGDVINGSLSMGSAIPFAGWVATGGKWGKRALGAEELAKLNRLARNGENIRIFAEDGKLLEHADLTLPETFVSRKLTQFGEISETTGRRAHRRVPGQVPREHGHRDDAQEPGARDRRRHPRRTHDPGGSHAGPGAASPPTSSSTPRTTTSTSAT